MITYTNIIGNATQANFSEKIHALEHAQKVDYVTLSSDDIQRKRLKATTASGKACGITLARDEKLYSGAILQLDDDYALVVKCATTHWLRCIPTDTAAAIELGYFAGNMHWPVKFEGETLAIERKGKISDYEDRLKPFIAAGRITFESDHG